MKRFLFIVILFSAMKGFGQMDSSQLKAYMEAVTNSSNKVKLRLDSTLPNGRLFQQKQIAQNWLSQGTWSHNTYRGKVYKMPYDNMLCLVPDSSATKQMPVIKTMPESRMPNAYKRKLPANR